MPPPRTSGHVQCTCILYIGMCNLLCAMCLWNLHAPAQDLWPRTKVCSLKCAPASKLSLRMCLQQMHKCAQEHICNCSCANMYTPSFKFHTKLFCAYTWQMCWCKLSLKCAPASKLSLICASSKCANVLKSIFAIAHVLTCIRQVPNFILPTHDKFNWLWNLVNCNKAL